MDRRERTENLEEAVMAALDGFQAGIWTALPCVVDNYKPADLGNGTVDVKPCIQARLQKPTGEFVWVDLPMLVDCPVVFPGGGGFTLTFPIQRGDEILVVFSSRCIDAWYQLGSPAKESGDGIQTQPQLDLRLHDLSDGFAIAGVKSCPRSIPDISTTTTQLRSDDGATFVEVGEAEITLKAATINMNYTTLNQTGTNTNIHSTVTQDGGQMSSLGTVVHTHVHTGVQSGSNNTGQPA